MHSWIATSGTCKVEIASALTCMLLGCSMVDVSALMERGFLMTQAFAPDVC